MPLASPIATLHARAAAVPAPSSASLPAHCSAALPAACSASFPSHHLKPACQDPPQLLPSTVPRPLQPLEKSPLPKGPLSRSHFRHAHARQPAQPPCAFVLTASG
eukprot:211733-Chlamydomonas_euryale.AAC.2